MSNARDRSLRSAHDAQVAGRRGVPNLKRFTDSAESYYQAHLEAVRDNDFNKRVTASWGLIAGGSRSLPFLMLMLRSSCPDSREDASGALEWLGEDSEGVVGELLVALKNESEDQPRDSLILALGALKSRTAITALAVLIRSDETDGDSRRCAVESLGRIVGKRFARKDDPEAAAIAWLDANDAD